MKSSSTPAEVGNNSDSTIQQHKAKRSHPGSTIGTQLIRVVIKRLDAIKDDAAHEKAYADFGMHMLRLLARGPSEEVTVAHLEAAADALGVCPSELIAEASS